MKKNVRHFTLVELMVVIAIMVLLMTMGLPMVSSLFHGNAVEQGANEFSAYCERIRTMAIKEGKEFSVIILTRFAATKAIPDNPLGNDVDVRFSRCAYRAGWFANSGSEQGLIYWAPRTEWKFLPEGAYFHYAKGRHSGCHSWRDDNQEYSGSESETKYVRPSGVLIPHSADGAGMLLQDNSRSLLEASDENYLEDEIRFMAWAITFKTDGTLRSDARVWIAQGMPNAEDVVPSLTPDENEFSFGDTSSNFYTNPDSGNLEGIDYEDGEQPFNCIMIEIPRSLGHPRAYSPDQDGYCAPLRNRD